MSDDVKDDTRPDPEASAQLARTEVTSPDMEGRTLGGRYEIVRKLARGGMGVVYLAKHNKLDRPVVLKVLSEHLSADTNAVSRFEREAKGLSTLDHPNIVTIHDYGHEGELAYIVMEYVEGKTLTELLREGGRFVFEEFLPIAVQTLDALAFAHDHEIVHRDVKTSNLMLTSRGGMGNHVKVLDFGLARLTESDSADITKGNLVGTVSYLAPEVITGSRADKRSDVYALGVMFYYLLAGKKPFQASDDMGVLYAHVNNDPPPITSVLGPHHAIPGGVMALVHRAMAKNPDDRPQDAREFLEAMGDVVSLPSLPAFGSGERQAIRRTQPTLEVPPPPPTSPNPSEFSVEHPPRGTNVNMVMFGVLLVLVIAVVGLLFLSPRDTDYTEVLQQAESLVEKGSYGAAESMLKPIEDQAGTDAKTLQKIAAVKQTIALKRGIAKAQRFEAEGDLDLAVSAYDDVLSIDGTNDVASKAISRLKAEKKAKVARIPVDVRTRPSKASVFVGNVSVGKSPIRLKLRPGKHRLRATKPGHTSWEQTVAVAGQPLELEVKLPAILKGASKSTAPKQKAVVKVTAVPVPDAGPPEPPPVEPEPAEKPPKKTGLLGVDGKESGLLPVD